MYINSERGPPSHCYLSQWKTAQQHLMKILFSSQEIKIIMPQINILPSFFFILIFLAIHMFSELRGGDIKFNKTPCLIFVSCFYLWLVKYIYNI